MALMFATLATWIERARPLFFPPVDWRWVTSAVAEQKWAVKFQHITRLIAAISDATPSCVREKPGLGD